MRRPPQPVPSGRRATRHGSCVGAAIHVSRTNVMNLFAWCNPLAGPTVYFKVWDSLTVPIRVIRCPWGGHGEKGAALFGLSGVRPLWVRTL